MAEDSGSGCCSRCFSCSSSVMTPSLIHSPAWMGVRGDATGGGEAVGARGAPPGGTPSTSELLPLGASAVKSIGWLRDVPASGRARSLGTGDAACCWARLEGPALAARVEVVAVVLFFFSGRRCLGVASRSSLSSLLLRRRRWRCLADADAEGSASETGEGEADSRADNGGGCAASARSCFSRRIFSCLCSSMRAQLSSSFFARRSMRMPSLSWRKAQRQDCRPVCPARGCGSPIRTHSSSTTPRPGCCGAGRACPRSPTDLAPAPTRSPHSGDRGRHERCPRRTPLKSPLTSRRPAPAPRSRRPPRPRPG